MSARNSPTGSPVGPPCRPAARSPFSAPKASVISASSTSCSAVRTSARRNSSSSLRRALTSIVPDLPCLLVMVCILAKGSGDYASPAYHDHPPQQLLQNFPDTTDHPPGVRLAHRFLGQYGAVGFVVES